LILCEQHIENLERPKTAEPVLKFESKSSGASASSQRRELAGGGAGMMSSGVRRIGTS
jgi:hypothetical protein